MAWKKDGWGTINQGQSLIIQYVFTNGQNMGAQLAMGIPENPGATLISDQETIITSSTMAVTYQFTLTNKGSASTVFGLQGGTFA